MPDGTFVPTVPATGCYYWKQISIFGNARIGDTAVDPPSTGVAHAAAVFIPSSGYNTGFYSMFDNACPSRLDLDA